MRDGPGADEQAADDAAVAVAAALAFVLGAIAQLQQAGLWPVPAYVASAAIGGLLAGAGRAAWGRRRWRVAAVALGAAALAFGVTGWRAADRLAHRLAPSLEGRDLVVVGVVAELPRATSTALRFAFDVESARGADGRSVILPPRVSLSWFTGHDATPPPRAIRGGERWQLPVRLQRPHGAVNPDGFDLELWLFERGIGATGPVRAGEAGVRWLGEAAAYPVLRLRQHLRDAIAARVPDPRTAGVLAALVVGDQGAIDRDDWAVFRDSGVAHLMSISGLHVTMFAWLAGAVVAALWRRSPRATLRVPTPQAARWGGLGLAAGYAAIAGWGVPAQRTLLMLAVVVAVRSAGLRWPGPVALLAAAVAVVALDPWALLQPGFWLSFAAVALLMFAHGDDGVPRGDGSWGRRLRAAAASGLRTQAVATVGLAPLTLLFFQQVSLIGFVANLVAIPVVTLLITPLALAGALLPPLWSVAAWAMGALQALLQLMVDGPWAVWPAPAAPAWASAAGIAGAVLLVWRRGPWRWRWLGVPLLLPMLAPAPSPPAHGRFELLAVDVGQGTAVLLRTHRHLLVYDAGPGWATGDAGERVLLPLLRSRGERRIDRLLLSHGDTDHVGGAGSLLAAMPVASVMGSLPADHPLRARPAPPWRDCVAGARWDWDGVSFDILHPPVPAVAGVKPNTQSCVLRVQDARGVSVLLTGDLEAAQEARLAIDGVPLASTAMMVPHHGSRTSSSAVFLDRVAPRLAFVQAAYRSRFGHPAPDVLARYAERGVEVVRSDECGAWRWDGDGAGACERDRVRRYWHHRP